MTRNHLTRAFLLTLLVSLLIPGSIKANDPRPYRILMVISEQWKDPRSFLIAEGGEFQTMVTLFKSWGIPFDIVRLDQRVLDANDFLDMKRRPRCGAIVWDVDSEHKISPQNFEVLKDAIERHHISLIAIGNRIKFPTVQELLGIEYKAEHLHSSHLENVEPRAFLVMGTISDFDLTHGGCNQGEAHPQTVSSVRTRLQSESGPGAPRWSVLCGPAPSDRHRIQRSGQ